MARYDYFVGVDRAPGGGYHLGMSAVQKRTPVSWTEEEYLDREENSEDKHEFIDGQISLMAGSRPEHSLLCGNVDTALNNLCGQLAGCSPPTCA